MKKDYIHRHSKYSFSWTVFEAAFPSQICNKYGVKEFYVSDGSQKYTIFSKNRPYSIKLSNPEDKFFKLKNKTRWLKKHPLTRIFK